MSTLLELTRTAITVVSGVPLTAEAVAAESDRGLSDLLAASAVSTPQQNGVVEWKNRMLMEIARTILVETGLSRYF